VNEASFHELLKCFALLTWQGIERPLLL